MNCCAVVPTHDEQDAAILRIIMKKRFVTKLLDTFRKHIFYFFLRSKVQTKIAFENKKIALSWNRLLFDYKKFIWLDNFHSVKISIQDNFWFVYRKQMTVLSRGINLHPGADSAIDIFTSCAPSAESLRYIYCMCPQCRES